MKKILICGGGVFLLLILVSLGVVSWIKVFGPISRLKDVDPNVRRRAVQDLPTSWVPDRVTRLTAALQDGDPGVSGAAAWALVEIGEPALGPLVATLRVGDLQTQGNAALALGKIGEPAFEPLLGALQDENPDLRKGAAIAMQQVLTAVEDPETRRRAVEPLIGAMKNKHVSGWARGCLCRIGEPAFEPLLGALQDEDIEVRRAAAVSLQCVMPAVEDPETRRRAVEPLIRLLKEEVEAGGMCYASGTLSKMGELALEPLLGIVLEQDARKGEQTRGHAVWALGQMVDNDEDPELRRKVMAPLIDRLQDETKSAAVRRNAACALGQILGGKEPQIIKRAVEALLTALENDSAVLCQHVARGLGRGFHMVAEPELARKAVPPLITALQDENGWVRVHAADSLGRIFSATAEPELAQKAVQPLVAALEDNNRSVRDRVAWALVQIGTERAEDAVRNAGFDPARPPSPPTRDY